MTDPSRSVDKRFTPFNFSDVAPFDSLSAALSELSLPHATQPTAPSSAFAAHELPVNPPSAEQRSEMLHAVIARVQEGDCVDLFNALSARNGTAARNQTQNGPALAPWVKEWEDSLLSQIQIEKKREHSPRTNSLRAPPKRPRRMPPQATVSSEYAQHRREAHDVANGLIRAGKPARVVTPAADSHEREVQLQKVSIDVDQDEFRDFVEYLRKILRKAGIHSATARGTDEASLGATANIGFMKEMCQKVVLFSDQGAVSHVRPQLLQHVIGVLQTRVRMASLDCDAVPRSTSTLQDMAVDASLGLTAAWTILTVLIAPGSPRMLLVEELLEVILRLFGNVCKNVIYPMCDPMYIGSRPDATPKSGKKAVKSTKEERSGMPTDDGDFKTSMYSGKALKGAMRNTAEDLIESCCSVFDLFTKLFLKERYLPDAVVTQSISICIQSLPVTGVVRLQTHAMKLLCSIFASYLHHRLSILDDVREAGSAVPSNRRHLRCFQLGGEHRNIRISSALMAQLLCLACTDGEDKPSKKERGEQSENSSKQSWVLLRRKQHDRAAKMAGHLIEPLLSRAYSDREPEYRVAFQALLEDMLSLYGLPDWPSAELILQTISVSIITKMRSAGEKRAFLKSVCVDILGTLAARMCTLYGEQILRSSSCSQPTEVSSEALERERENLLVFLDSKKSLAISAAYRFYEALFVTDDHSIATSRRETSCQLADIDGQRDGNCSDEVLDGQDAALPTDEELFDRVQSKALLREERVTARRSQNEQIDRRQASEAARFIGINRSFARGFKTILDAILDGTHDAAPTVRAKSVKALTVVEESCEGLLRAFPELLANMELRSRDASTLTRDAALDLLSRSLVLESKKNGQGHRRDDNEKDAAAESGTFDATLFERIFAIVERRLPDMSTLVRKRAISIMRSVLSSALSICETIRERGGKTIDGADECKVYERRVISICVNLVGRLEDPENSVREAAERTLRHGLFGFDSSQPTRVQYLQSSETAAIVAERMISVYGRLPSTIHSSLMSRVADGPLLEKYKSFFTSIVDAVVEQFHDFEAKLASAIQGKSRRDLSEKEAEGVRVLSGRRVACSAVICAFGTLQASLVGPHCRALAPSIKGVVGDGALANSTDVACVQRILKTLEIGLGESTDLDNAFLEEVLYDVELIMCQCPVSMLEEASVRCLCVVTKKAGTSEAKDVLLRAANLFVDFLRSSEDKLRNYCAAPLPDRESPLERNARVALVRLGLLSRYGEFDDDFVANIYDVFHSVFQVVGVRNRKDTLARAAIRALSHLMIRHRSQLEKGTTLMLSAMDTCARSEVSRSGTIEDANFGSPQELAKFGEGVQLEVLQWFQDLLRDEEDRNSSGQYTSGVMSVGKAIKEMKQASIERRAARHDEKNARESPRLEKAPVLAAEEDAEAGFLAGSAQSMVPRLFLAVNSPFVPVRRTVANVLGLLVRQGLVLPATVVTSLFSLLLDKDKGCRDYSFRVVSFLADRHSGMLASAALSAMRSCFETSFAVRYLSQPIMDEGDQTIGGKPIDVEAGYESLQQVSRRVPTADEIVRLCTDEKTGHSLLSQAVMAIRRDQRRGILESLMREFDPRVSTKETIHNDHVSDTQVPDRKPENHDVGASGTVKPDVDRQRNDDDDLGDVAGKHIDLLSTSKLSPLPVLYFFAATLSSIDYTNGAGIGGSLTQGGGTAAADARMKQAREDVTDLIGIATRIISNSGQATLRVAKQVMRQRLPLTERKKQTVRFSSRISLLLQLKNHLKNVRWKLAVAVDDGNKDDVDLAAAGCRMPEFSPLTSPLELLRVSQAQGSSPNFEDLADGQLANFDKLMREDAIDERDITMGQRRSRYGGGNRRKSVPRTSATKSAKKKTAEDLTPTAKRDRLPRRVSTNRSKKSCREIESSEDDEGSDFDPGSVA